jgi:hypothetical protein
VNEGFAGQVKWKGVVVAYVVHSFMAYLLA